MNCDAAGPPNRLATAAVTSVVLPLSAVMAAGKSVGRARAQGAQRQPHVLAEQPGQLRAQPPGRSLQLGRLVGREERARQGVPQLEGVLVALPVGRVGRGVVVRRVRVRLPRQVIDMSAHRRAGRVPIQAAL
jgi:hypothetical protein